MIKQLLLIIFLFTTSSILAQDEEYWELESDTSRFYIGLNLNAYFANHNTAILYSGQPNVTSFGIEYIFNEPQNQQIFDDFFGAPYRVVEYPVESKYRVAVDIGLHFQYQIDNSIGFYADFNIAQIDYEQFFTVQVDDPTNGIPGPTLLRFPIIGEENRFNLNLGTQVYFYQGETSTAYFSVFGNVNNIRVQSNYIVVDNIQYNIFHNNEDSPSLQPGGNGYGAGLGLGFRFQLSEKVVAGINYQAIYSRVNLSEVVNEIGLQNTVGVRTLWKF